MRRPQARLRVLGAATALGALGVTSQSSAVVPGATTAATPGASVADVAVAQRRLNVVPGSRGLVSGRVSPAVGGKRVALQKRTGKGWRTFRRTTTKADGRFDLRFRPGRSGSTQVRVRVDRSHERVGRLNVYRRASASWYGPGLYGNRLGCGGRLTAGTMGVAHKTLRCGSRVTLRHEGRTVRVPVVDRGPFVGGREFDLTAATKRRLGFDGVGTILVSH